MGGPRRNYIQRSTGQKVIGVTTGLNVLAKPALLWWAYKQGFINYEELCKLIAKTLNNKKLEPEAKVEMLLELMATFQVLGLYEKRDEAANAGTLGHEFIENHLRGLPDPSTKGLPSKVVEKAEGCYITFLDWEKTHHLEVHGSEVQLTSEKLPFGGTLDHLINTSLTKPPDVEILDIKTGKDIYFEAKVQVGTYGFLWEEHHPDRPVKGYHILRLGPNGEFTHKFFPELNDYIPIFDACLDIQQRMKAMGEKL